MRNAIVDFLIGITFVAPLLQLCNRLAQSGPAMDECLKAEQGLANDRFQIRGMLGKQ